jgi:hypothetical protein
MIAATMLKPWPRPLVFSVCRRHVGPVRSRPASPLEGVRTVGWSCAPQAGVRRTDIHPASCQCLLGSRQSPAGSARLARSVPAGRSFSGARTAIRLHSRCGQRHRPGERPGRNPRSLLSMARLNSASSRTCRSIWSLVRMAQACFCRRGGLGSISLPLFQGNASGRLSLEFRSRAWSHSSAIHGGRPCPIVMNVGAFAVAIGA